MVGFQVRPSQCGCDVYSRLLEAYLVEYSTCSGGDDSERQKSISDKITNLLQEESASYDVNRALVLCRLKHYNTGILYLYEKAHL